MASASEILKAYLHCARTPAEDAVERIRTQLKKQYGAAEVELTVSVEPDLISGYVLQVGGRVFDNSGKSALAAITADAPSLAVMQTRVEDYKPAATTAEGGTVTRFCLIISVSLFRKSSSALFCAILLVAIYGLLTKFCRSLLLFSSKFLI